MMMTDEGRPTRHTAHGAPAVAPRISAMQCTSKFANALRCRDIGSAYVRRVIRVIRYLRRVGVCAFCCDVSAEAMSHPAVEPANEQMVRLCASKYVGSNTYFLVRSWMPRPINTAEQSRAEQSPARDAYRLSSC